MENENSNMNRERSQAVRKYETMIFVRKESVQKPGQESEKLAQDSAGGGQHQRPFLKMADHAPSNSTDSMHGPGYRHMAV